MLLIAQSPQQIAAPLNVPLNAGSLVVYSQVGAVSGGGANATPIQPTPRATANGTLAYDVQFDTNAVSTTLAANVQSAAPADGSPTTILVADSTGIGAGDYITIAASSASSTLAADLNNVSTSIGVATGTGSTFRVGDILRIPGETASATTGTVVIAGATSLPVTPVMTVVVGDTVNVSDAKFTTTLSAASAAAVTTITVTSAAGLAGGQSVTISDAFQTSETVTIASIAGTTATLSAGLAGSWGSGSQVTRNAIGPNPYTVQTATAISPITLTAVLPALSTQAQVTLMRRTEDVRVTAIATDTLTVVRLGTPQAADYHRMGTQIALLSQPEVRRVTAITSNILTLNSALGFMHRAAAAVNKQPQGVMVFSTLPTNIVIGDTVVIDMLSIATFADTVADRVQATIQAIDTLTKSVTVTTAAARTRVDYTTATVTFMGDAVVVSGAVDSNGNTVRSTSGNRVNLSNGTSK